MEPLVPIHAPVQKFGDSNQPRGTLADIGASGLAVLAAIAALGFSLLFFIGFLENDTHLWGVVSAFILCFGVGAFAYGPAVLIALIAKRAYKNGADRKGMLTVILLLVPWAVLSYALVFVSDFGLAYSLAILIITLTLFLWAIVSFVRA